MTGIICAAAAEEPPLPAARFQRGAPGPLRILPRGVPPEVIAKLRLVLPVERVLAREGLDVVAELVADGLAQFPAQLQRPQTAEQAREGAVVEDDAPPERPLAVLAEDIEVVLPRRGVSFGLLRRQTPPLSSSKKASGSSSRSSPSISRISSIDIIEIPFARRLWEQDSADRPKSQPRMKIHKPFLVKAARVWYTTSLTIKTKEPNT